jgi:bis(5'-nucleosyl)-tetraphosphatase (symmetrical)
VATYAIGDIQGCFDSLTKLLARIGFDPAADRLWLVGDLVNRGPRSLEVLRWAHDLGDRAVAVLGNHDLHLLMRAAGVIKKKKLDTLDRILDASDCDRLLDWLRHRPLLHREGDRVMVHAGLHPAWSMETAAALAAEVEALLRAPDWRARIRALKKKEPPAWRADLTGAERLQAITGVLLRTRVCTPDGRIAHQFSGPPREAPAGYIPWYAVPGACWRTPGQCVVFGHWAALGLHLDAACMGLDTGCVWGGALTAVRLEDRRVVRVPAVEPASQRP